MDVRTATMTLQNMKECFDRSTRPLTEEHSSFAPKGELFTTAQQVAHVAQTIEWFIDGSFGAKGFDMDFEKAERVVRTVTSLTAARAWFDRAVAGAIRTIESKSDAQLAEIFSPNPIMGEMPKWSIFGALSDHTAHHRGALTVYSRLLGLTPPMPYMEM